MPLLLKILRAPARRLNSPNLRMLQVFHGAKLVLAVITFDFALLVAVLSFCFGGCPPSRLRPLGCLYSCSHCPAPNYLFLSCPCLSLWSLPFWHTEFASMGSSGRLSLIAPAAILSAALFDENATRRPDSTSWLWTSPGRTWPQFAHCRNGTVFTNCARSSLSVGEGSYCLLSASHPPRAWPRSPTLVHRVGFCSLTRTATRRGDDAGS